MYDDYKMARDAAWKVLIECGICSLPVDLTAIAQHYQYKIICYSDCSMAQSFRPEVLDGDGFIADIAGTKHIFINDKIETRGRRRFTLAHEIGHGALQHDLRKLHFRHGETDSSDIAETQANIFARDILMPARVLAALGVHTPEEIMELCSVSRQSAEIRAERLAYLYHKNKFDSSPLERQIFKQFQAFVQKYLQKQASSLPI